MDKLPYIHLEGLDLSGKTSVSLKILEKKPLYKRRYNSLLPDIQENPYLIKADVLNNSDNPNLKNLFDLFKDAINYDINNITEQNHPLVQDSTILIRTLANLSTSNLIDYSMEKNLINLGERYPKFTKSVVLTCSYKVRKERLTKRKKELSKAERLVKDYFLIESNPDLFFEKERKLIKYSQDIFNSEILDTTNMSIEEIYSHIFK